MLMKDYLKELNLPYRVLMGPGPSNVHPRVLQAMLTPILGHLDPDFHEVTDHIKEMLRHIFRANEGLTLSLSATGMAGMEAAFCNLVEPGDRVVIAVNGFFGGRMVDVASRCGAEVHQIEVPWGKPVLPEMVEKALKGLGKVKAVAVVHGETSTGVISPVEDIASVVHDHEALLIVDAVTTLGGMELSMDQWGLDVCYSGSQKCLGAPSGLSPISFGPRALEVLQNRETNVQSFYLDLSVLESYWSEKRSYHHTVPTVMFYAFREALRMIMEEGVTDRWQRHTRNAAALRAGLRALGLELFADPDYMLDPLTTVLIPDGVDGANVIGQLYKEHSIEIGGGLGEVKGKIWRIGLMGESCKSSNVLLVLSALERILPKEGYEVAQGSGVAAAQQIL